MIIFLFALLLMCAPSSAMEVVTTEKSTHAKEPSLSEKLHGLLSGIEENVTIVRDYQEATDNLFARLALSDIQKKSANALVNEIKVESMAHLIAVHTILLANKLSPKPTIPLLKATQPFCTKFDALARLINPTRKLVYDQSFSKLTAAYQETGLSNAIVTQQATIDISVIAASKLFDQVALDVNFALLKALTKELGEAINQKNLPATKQVPTITHTNGALRINNNFVIAAPDIKATYTLVIDPSRESIDTNIVYDTRVSSLFGKDFGTNQEIIAKERGLSDKKSFWATLYKCFPQEFDRYLPDIAKCSVLTMPNGKKVPSLILDGSITLWDQNLTIPCQYQWGFDEESITAGKPLCYHRCAKPRDGGDFSGDFDAHFPALSSK